MAGAMGIDTVQVDEKKNTATASADTATKGE
jgi:hypothetical protein